MFRFTSVAVGLVLLVGGDVSAEWWSIGPADPQTAKVGYDPSTGEFMVSVNQVLLWELGSDVPFIDDGWPIILDGFPFGSCPDPVFILLPPPYIKHGCLEPITYTDVYLGQLVEPETPVSAFSLEYIASFGGPIESGAIAVVPEPSMFILTGTAFVGLLVYFWRKRHRPA